MMMIVSKCFSFLRGDDNDCLFDLQEAHVELPQDEARALQRTLRNQGEDRWVGGFN
jgi:hypothetical protein